MASHVVAGLFNSQRVRTADKVHTIIDHHPLANRQLSKPLSGDQVNARYTAHLEATGHTVEWLEDE